MSKFSIQSNLWLPSPLRLNKKYFADVTPKGSRETIYAPIVKIKMSQNILVCKIESQQCSRQSKSVYKVTTTWIFQLSPTRQDSQNSTLGMKVNQVRTKITKQVALNLHIVNRRRLILNFAIFLHSRSTCRYV